MLQRFGQLLARFVGLASILLGLWLLIVNVPDLFGSDRGYQGAVLAWILLSGALGAIGGMAFLLSFDGSQRFRTMRTRVWGWLGMFFGALLPHSLTPLILPLVVVVSPIFFRYLRPVDEPTTSS